MFTFLDAFALVAKIAYQLHVRPSVRPPARLHVPARLSLDGFSSNLIAGIFGNIFREIPDLVKVGQKYAALYMKT
jgi:hypothetical protein